MTSSRDATPSANADWLRALQRTAGVSPRGTRTLALAIEEIAARHPDRPALVDESTTLDYAALAARTRSLARWARSQGLAAGDQVALVMANSADYAAIWIGLTRIGIVVALVNTHLSGDALAHSLALAGAREVIVDDMAGAWTVAAALPCASIWVRAGGPGDARTADSPAARSVRVTGDDDSHVIASGAKQSRGYVSEQLHIDCASLEDALAALPDDPADDLQVPCLADQALLIYTSGTTGLPKAARVSHYRIMMWSEWFAGIMDARSDDRLYDCLPMYHSTGGVVAIGAMLVAGGCVVIRNGFSARRFWPDVVASKATIFQYIGELCRYLVHAPDDPAAREHRLRLCCGNGLRADVWEAFAARFGRPRIVEFYAATEGSFSLFNLEGRPGAIGRIPGFMAHRSPVAIVAFDMHREEPRRGPDGFCLRCAVDEPGEAIGLVSTEDDGLATRFEGYTSDSESDRKLLRDVFVKGDAWFRTGDLMRKDAQGFYAFVDRIGDTFRWKGENVATTEVADAIGSCAGVLDATVYGVEVPNAEGRAGMAALVVAPDFSLDAFAAHAAARLPRYARTVFVRLCTSLETTGTFKTRKADLVQDGFDPNVINDPLYVLREDRYVRLDTTLHEAIVRGDVRL